jgi:hypothetical protein
MEPRLPEWEETFIVTNARTAETHSFPNPSLETIGRIDFERQQEKAVRRRSQPLELVRAVRTRDKVVQQRHLFRSVEHAYRQLGEVGFEPFVGRHLRACHLLITAS